MRLETVLDGQLVIGRAGQFGHDNLAAAVAKILRMGVSLRAVAQNGHRLVLQQRNIGVFVVINFGGHFSSTGFQLG